jgi:protein-L-isoaspartate(D-aspartate) O-methyltransferase
MEHEAEFCRLREEMVVTRIATQGIRDRQVLAAMVKVPRHRFVPPKYLESAYQDHPLPIGEGQTISQPYMVALMTERLALKGNEKVLEIGTGSGYQTAILAELVREVYSVEKFPSLAEGAGKLLNDLGYKNVKVIVGDGSRGLEDKAPFDSIIVTAGTPSIPPTLIAQLADKGKMVIPVGDSFSQTLIVTEKDQDEVKTTSVCGCVFVPLVGEYGWKK